MENWLKENLEGLNLAQVSAYKAGYDAGYRAKQDETCMYSRDDKSVRCEGCNGILCPACGYEKDGVRMCNECHNRWSGNPEIAQKNGKNNVSKKGVCAICHGDYIEGVGHEQCYRDK